MGIEQSQSWWIKLRPDTLRKLLDCCSGASEGRKDFATWIVSLSKTGDRLNKRERHDLLFWLDQNGFKPNRLDEIYTIQYTHDQCASALGCDRKQAIRYRKWFEEIGMIREVRGGRKGYATLFVLAPFAFIEQEGVEDD